ncbi:MAG: hypothetical protein U5L00_06375 [Desulfovermiculus sp.]|nr:hypothetical protein [Desulfovermiculus sp.]
MPAAESYRMQGHGGHRGGDHHAHMVADFKKRFWISIAATIPILILSPMIQAFLGFKQAFGFPGDMYVLWALASFVFVYGGWPFLKGLFDELGEKHPGMMTLIAVAITTAYAYSSVVVFGLAGKVFFWELATLIDLMLLGRWFEMIVSVVMPGMPQTIGFGIDSMPATCSRKMQYSWIESLW